MRPRPVLVALAVSVVVIAGVVIGFWAIGFRGSSSARFSTADLTPRNVDFYLAMNADSTSAQWATVTKLLGTLNASTPAHNTWNQLLNQQGVNWDKDVVAQLDNEAYIAVTDFSKLDAGHGMVGAIRLRDTNKAKKTFLTLFNSTAGSGGDKVVTEQYHGLTISYVQQSDSSDRTAGVSANGAIAFVGREAVIGLSLDDVKGVIDVAQGHAPKLRDNPRFQKLRGLQKDDFLLWGYVNLAAVWDRAGDFTNLLPVAGANTGAALQQARGHADQLMFALSAKQQGFVLDATVLPAQGTPNVSSNSTSSAFPPATAQRLPGDTMFLFSGANAYEQLYNPISAAAGENHNLGDALAQFERDAGFKLDADLFGLMKSEYTIAGNFADKGNAAADFSVLALAEVQNVQRVTQSLDLLGRYLVKQNIAVVSGADANGVRRISDRSSPSDGIAWAPSGKTLVLGYPDTAVQQYAKGAAGKSLADDGDWQATMTALPDKKSAVVYLNIARLLDAGRSAAGLDSEIEQNTGGSLKYDDLRPIRALGISSSTANGGVTARLVLVIAK